MSPGVLGDGFYREEWEEEETKERKRHVGRGVLVLVAFGFPRELE